MNTAAPKEVGLSPDRLGRIRTAMGRYVDEGKLAGILTVVARRGQIAHFETCGMMDVEAGKPMQPDTIFRIYSMSKPITSVAVMMLYEEGDFHLTDPISRYIPEFEETKVFVEKTETGLELADLERPVTIRDLLTHTSGLAYGIGDPSYVDALYEKQIWEVGRQRPETTLEEMVWRIAALPLAHQPGSAWRYSMATDVLGYLVQVVSGMPFEAYLQQRIFEPLGMVDTDFYVPQGKGERFAALYGPAKGGGLERLDVQGVMAFDKPTRRPSGGGGLVSTASDYMRFSQMLLNKGELDGTRLLGRKTVELMTMNHLPDGLHPSEDQSAGFGLGFSVVTDVARSQSLGSVGRYGWGGAANTRFWIDPQEEMIGLLMLQFMPGGYYPVAEDFNVAVYQAIVE